MNILPSEYSGEFKIITVNNIKETIQFKIPNISNNQTITHLEYEGGLTIWECEYDLVRYLTVNTVLPNSKVLELGCGFGLAGVYIYSLSNINITFQDYNKEVLEQATIPTFYLNCVDNKTGNINDVKFIAGSWQNIEDLYCEYDLVLGSELLYCTEYYPSLMSLIVKCCKKTSKILLATKRLYFGLDGSVFAFTDYCTKNYPNIKIEKVMTINNGVSNIRDILLLTFI